MSVWSIILLSARRLARKCRVIYLIAIYDGAVERRQPFILGRNEEISRPRSRTRYHTIHQFIPSIEGQTRRYFEIRRRSNQHVVRSNLGKIRIFFSSIVSRNFRRLNTSLWNSIMKKRWLVWASEARKYWRYWTKKNKKIPSTSMKWVVHLWFDLNQYRVVYFVF